MYKRQLVAKLDLLFPEYSSSKRFSVKPDIVEIPDHMSKPVYDLIIGVETMAKMGVVLDFGQKEITIDHISLQMKDLKSYSKSNALHNLLRTYVEPTSTKEATKRVVEILDAKYEKANLAEVVHDHCGHLTSQQKISFCDF